MRTYRCKECQKDMSSKAKACPGCGAPAKKRSLLVRAFLIFVGVGFVIGIVSQNNSAAPSQQVSTASKIEEIQQKLKALPITGRSEDAEKRGVLLKELHRLGGN